MLFNTAKVVVVAGCQLLPTFYVKKKQLEMIVIGLNSILSTITLPAAVITSVSTVVVSTFTSFGRLSDNKPVKMDQLYWQ